VQHVGFSSWLWHPVYNNDVGSRAQKKKAKMQNHPAKAFSRTVRSDNEMTAEPRRNIATEASSKLSAAKQRKKQPFMIITYGC